MNKKQNVLYLSYCPCDAEIVSPIIQALEMQDYIIWKYTGLQIQHYDGTFPVFGANLYRSIVGMLCDCDVAVSFISKATIESNIYQRELEVVLDMKINNQIKWCLVKIDTVNLDQGFPRLSQFAYIDYAADKDMNAVVHDIERKLEV